MEALHGTILEWAEAPDQIEQWSEVEALREEISRLRRLVEQTARWLRERGHPQKAAMVRRDLQELDADARL